VLCFLIGKIGKKFRQLRTHYAQQNDYFRKI
jgi:hypothetical protein